jgi:hypothetical protein
MVQTTHRHGPIDDFLWLQVFETIKERTECSLLLASQGRFCWA